MGYIENFCRKEETKAINNRLNKLYITWYETKIVPNSNLSISNNKGKKLNPLHLLTCTDSYLDSDNRCIIFGQESHDTKSEETLFSLCPQQYHLKDNGYLYNEEIHSKNVKAAPRTLFLQQRFKLAGLSECCKNREQLSPVDKSQFESILLNNLNKTSFEGEHTSVKKKGIIKQIYEEFEFEGRSCTVFEHEFQILKPRKIVFLCGKSYFNHIRRDFKTLFESNLDEIQNGLGNLKLNEKYHQVSEPIRISYKPDEADAFCTDIILGYHPNAHMKEELRATYDECLVKFVKG